jgi:predicted porin
MTPGVTHVGLRGSEKLGGGLSAIWQIENAVAIEGAATPASTFASRNSNLGILAGFGVLFVGNWDTPYMWSTLTVASPVRGPFPGDLSTALNTPGFNVPAPTTQSGRVNSPADAAFNRRQGNSIQYWTPNWQGLSGRVAYSVPEGKGQATNGANISPEIFGLGLEYENGPLRLRYAYARHDDYFGLAQLGATASANPSNANSLAASSKDEGHKVLAIYTIGNTRLVAAFDRLKYSTEDRTAGNVNSYDRNAFWGMIEQIFGGVHRVWLGGGVARKGSCSVVGGGRCTTDGLGAKSWTFGYRYDAFQADRCVRRGLWGQQRRICKLRPE